MDPEETRTERTWTVPRTGAGSEGTLRLPIRYALGERLGKGGFGSVFAARDQLLNRDVALKVLAARAGARSEAMERETSALRLLDLPGVVRLLDSGSSEGTPWFVMERIEGSPFPDGSEQVPWERLRTTVIELFRALARIHRAGYVHGDLKPSNVIVRPDGAPVILDLGLARATSDSGPPSLGGTPLYMAPEQVTGRGATAASDLYAVGLMLWRGLSGRWPHGDLPARARILMRLTHDAPPLSTVGVSVPRPLEALIAHLLEREPARRPRSALACVERLTPADERYALNATPVAAADLSAIFLGRERLLHVPSTAATILWERGGGDPVRIQRTLDAWLLLGVVSRASDRLRMAEGALERLAAGWAPEQEAAEPREPVGGAIPGSPLGLCLAFAASQDGSAPASALALARQERARGRLKEAAVCLVEGLRSCWRSAESPLESALLSEAAELALANWSVGAIDEAIDLIGRGRIRRRGELDLLRAARALQDGRREMAMTLLEEGTPEDSRDLQRARHDVRLHAIVNGPLDPEGLARLEEEVTRWVEATGPEEERHLHRWRARILYRLGRMREAGAEAERAAELETAPFDRMNALFAAAVAWIEAAEVERTTTIATEARALAEELRLPRFEARAELLLRSLLNRSGRPAEPDLGLVEAAREIGAPHTEGLLAVTEAVIAWRAGHPASRELAAGARSAFAAAGYAEAGAFALAIEIASGAGDARQARELAEQVCAARRPDIAIEVLGLLACSGKLEGDWRQALEDQAQSLPNLDPDWRAGALSLREARLAVESPGRYKPRLDQEQREP